MSLHGPHQVAQKSTNTAWSACASSSPCQPGTAPACADAAQLTKQAPAHLATPPPHSLTRQRALYMFATVSYKRCCSFAHTAQDGNEGKPALTCKTSASKVSSVTSSRATGPWRAGAVQLRRLLRSSSAALRPPKACRSRRRSAEQPYTGLGTLARWHGGLSTGSKAGGPRHPTPL